MFINRMPRYEVLSGDALVTLERGWERLATEVGIQFDHPRALELFRAAGQRVDGDVVRFEPGFLTAQAAQAPAEFALKARNPRRDLTIGGDAMIFGPANGPPFVRVDGQRREGTMADLERLLMMVQVTDALDTPGRNILEPNDVPLDVRHLLRALAATRLTDRVWSGEPSSETAARDCIRIAEIVHGGRDVIERDPVLFANINVNSPLHFDVRMLEGLLAYAEARQAIMITPFLLMGAMAPVSVPAALVQQTAEALAGIALVQLVRPGTPCVMGSFLSTTDMKSGSPAFGGPESAVGLYASGQIARHLGLPWRAGGGTLTASQVVDFQAGYEAFNTVSSAFMAGANVCWQSAGWLEGGLVTSFEKFAADCELLDLLHHQFTPLEINEESLAYDAHVEVGHSGHFFGAGHTLERFRDCFWRPTVASTENFERWARNGSRNHSDRADTRWRAMLEDFERPALDDAVEAELVDFVEQRARELGDPVSVT
ncbi:MAG: Trimethylamine methyltransferase family protein [uncultured Nocardioidaceae bacterium]|uniref:Methyltransferase n=1 Tax=uncultured Nocardioidaceae bacterium TaxID=253824 RepID=A0A6J4MJ99_9ACTN|nr:MAG: Trimethylamine methyltransferase family protein [uncultured Nocardioidaceae bacterium]